MNNTKHRKIMFALILVAIITVSVIGTYAYFLTSAGINEEQKLTIKTGTLSLTFEDNDEGLTGQIMLGESKSKEFRIRNTGTEQVTTNMLWSGLVNTYIEESLSYTLEYKTSEEGTWQTVSTVSRTNIPQSERTSDYNLATGLTIPSGQTYFYKLTITFNNLLDVNQEADKTAILSTKFKLGDMVVEASSEKTLAHLKLTSKEGNPTFANAAIEDETAEGLYSLEDNYGISYYYRGAVENNYVKFGGFYWRIIRINGDGSIRMQYDGTQAYENSNGGQGFGGEDRFALTNIAWNTTNGGDAKYVGYMYGGENGTASTKKDLDGTESTETEKSKAATYNQTSSNVKIQVESWYKTNIEDKGFSKYISDEIFCNDRTTPGSGITGSSADTGLGYGANFTGYGAAARIRLWNSDTSKIQSQFICEQKNDAFTVSDTTKGNGALTYPVGLITADEVVAAGSGKTSTSNQYYYLWKSNGRWYWTFSPRSSSDTITTMFGVLQGGTLSNGGVNSKGDIAPVINIAPEYSMTLIGTGTMDSPYQIPGLE